MPWPFFWPLPLTAFAGASAADKKDKQKPAANQTVDSGSFGIFIKGQRVATETFHIEQQNGNSVIKSQLKETSGADSTSQKSDLEMSSSGELLRYEWSQSSGGSLSVFPDNEFLKEQNHDSASAKPAEQAFLLPAVTPILDNNFFIHREVLAWKYLNAVCQPCGRRTKCRQAAGGLWHARPPGPYFDERPHGTGRERESHDPRHRARTAAPEPVMENSSSGPFGWTITTISS